MTIKTVIHDKETDDYYLQFDDSELQQLGWNLGDKIEWIENTTREYRLIQKYMGELCQKQLIS